MRATAPITVCIGTYGDLDRWGGLAQRAMDSVRHQSLPPSSVRWCHDVALHSARNNAALNADTPWLCFLDADDELDSEYLWAMTQRAEDLDGPALIQPATIGVHPDGHEDANSVLIPTRPLLEGNYLVIGTLIPTELFNRVGCFFEWPCYEDWDLWLRATAEGAAVTACRDAVYRVHVNAGGRNSPDRDHQIAVYNEIRHSHLGRR
jgi:glycosyltransferase involved in cell wall biosynthesis